MLSRLMTAGTGMSCAFGALSLLPQEMNTRERKMIRAVIRFMSAIFFGEAPVLDIDQGTFVSTLRAGRCLVVRLLPASY